LISALDLEKYAGKYLSRLFPGLKGYEEKGESGRIPDKPTALVIE